MDLFDVLIVGNGILAYSLVFSLLQEHPTVKIGIVGPAIRPGGATSAAGAMLGCFGEITKTSLNSSYGRAKLGMSIRATNLWPEWLEGINEHIDKPYQVNITPGTLVILNSKSGSIDDENYDAIIDALRTHDQPYKDVDPRALDYLDPIEDCRPTRAMYLPNEGSLSSVLVLQNLQHIAEHSPGVKIFNSSVRELHVSTGQIHSVKLETGEMIAAEHVVIAAGASSQVLIDQLPNSFASHIPRLFAGVGFSLVAEQAGPPIPSVVRTPNRSFSCGLHVLPRGNDLYIGATNNVRLTPVYHPNMGDIHFLMECAIQQIHQGLEQAEVLLYVVGNRPVTIDTFPLIGHTSIDGLWMLTGTYREGFHLSPLLAQHMAKQILGKGEMFENLFLPERPPIIHLTKQQAIEDTVNHLMAVGYEASMKLPSGWQEVLRRTFFDKVRTIYEELDSDYVLPPNFFSLIERNHSELIPYFRDYYRSLPYEKPSIDLETSKEFNQALIA